MGAKKGGRKAFTLVLDQDTVRVRKAHAPVGRAMTPARDRKPRRRPDYLDEHLAGALPGREDA